MTAHEVKPTSPWLRRLLGVFLLGLGLFAIVLTGYTIYLDRTITATFEGRRWSVPSHVYAQALELYPGKAFNRTDLLLELQRLGYTDKTSPGDSGQIPAESMELTPGSYRALTGGLLVYLRAFEFLDQPRAATLVQIRFRDGRIGSINNAFGHPVGLIRLEPPLIGSTFPSHGEDRVILRPDQTPERLLEGLKVVEDRKFDHHVGFDLEAIARAFWVNLTSRSLRQGGSTLTQQLVKSYFLDNRRTLARKLKELLMAVILDARFEKADLLNAYVNEIYLGQDGDRAIHGFGLASQFYFNKPLTELRIDEIALLIAIIRGPSYYNPFKHPERALERRNRVLSQMQAFAVISAPEYKQAMKHQLALAGDVRRGGSYYPAFMDLVRDQLAQDYPEEQLSSAGLRVFTTLDPRIQEAVEAAGVSSLEQIELQRQLPKAELQIASIVSSTQTGEILAVVGGRKAGFQGFNRALKARRPVGSLVKPIIYLTALESGEWNLTSRIEDEPISLSDPDSGQLWAPENFDKIHHGSVPLVRALGDSLNLATVQLGVQIGVERIADRIANLLQKPPPPAYPSLLLGAMELSPLEVTRLYSIISGGGYYSPLKSVISVVDENNQALSRYPIEVQQLADTSSVVQLEYALQAVMKFGTGKRSPLRNAGVAGKTGTSDEFRDSWFAGFDDQHLAVIWVGYDDNRTTGLTGSSGALPVWNRLMSTLKATPLSIPLTANLKWVTVDYDSGALANASCSSALISLPVPEHAPIARKPGCGGTLKDLGERFKRWLNQ